MPSDERLTLSWFGKDQTLIRTQLGGDQWVERNDLRVDEVRLLHETDAIGEVGVALLGDNLVRLVSCTTCIDTHSRICQRIPREGHPELEYRPSLQHWAGFYRLCRRLGVSRMAYGDRLRALHELLTPTGTIWVHLDSTEVHRCRCLMDDEFGHENYLATVIWAANDSEEPSAPNYGCHA